MLDPAPGPYERQAEDTRVPLLAQLNRYWWADALSPHDAEVDTVISHSEDGEDYTSQAMK